MSKDQELITKQVSDDIIIELTKKLCSGCSIPTELIECTNNGYDFIPSAISLYTEKYAGLTKITKDLNNNIESAGDDKEKLLNEIKKAISKLENLVDFDKKNNIVKLQIDKDCYITQ
ncbi:hypothetical protein V6O07_24070, partial [Arthrospira platensis SPKY2]